jgi:hypothetical protein
MMESELHAFLWHFFANDPQRSAPVRIFGERVEMCPCGRIVPVSFRYCDGCGMQRPATGATVRLDQ